MIRPATVPLRGVRTNALVVPIAFRGVDLTGATLSAAVLQDWDNDPASPEIVPTVTLSGVVDDGGVPVSNVSFSIAKAVMEAVPEAAEVGEDLAWVWSLDVQTTASVETKFRYLEGPFLVGGTAGGRGAVGSLTVTVADQTISVEIDGAAALGALVTEATEAAAAAEAAAAVAESAAESLSMYSNVVYVAAHPELNRLRLRLATATGAWPTGLTVGVKYFARDDGGPSGAPGDRLLFQVVDAADDSLLFAFLIGGASIDPNEQPGFNGGLGRVVAPLVLSTEAVALGFVEGEAEVDFGAGDNFGQSVPHDPQDTAVIDSRVAFGATDVEAIRSIASAAQAGNYGVFNDTVTDEYLLRLVREARPTWGDPTTSYVLNYEMMDNGPEAGANRYRIQFRAYDPVRGKDIGSRGIVSATDFRATIPEQLFLTQAADGNINEYYDLNDPDHVTYYTGEVMTITIDRSVLEWGHSLTTYTDPADAGIKPAHVLTNDECDLAIEHPQRPALHKRVAAAGADYTTVQAAYDAIYLPDLTVGRASFPLSDLSTPSHPALFELVDHEEEITPRVVAGLGTGLVVPHFSILRGLGASRLYMDDPSSAPVIELNRSGTIEDLVIEQLGTTNGGYCIHIDGAGKLTIPAQQGLPVLRYRDRVIVRRATIITHSLHASGSCIGMGFGNGMRVLFDECRFVRVGAGSAPEVTCHTSPNTTVPGVLHFRNCTGNFTIQLIKSDAMDVQHRLIVENSQVRWIKCANGIGGHSAFVWSGSTAGLTPVAEGAVVDGTYSDLLDDFA